MTWMKLLQKYGVMEPDDTYELKRRFFDKGLFQWHFRIKYVLLKALGLNVYSALSFCLGFASAVGVFYWLLRLA